MAVVDGRLFTQEQRGEQEAVVCLDADTGAEIWSHLEPGRFWDSLSSTGPRATPTFADGRIYAQGATGTLVCLDAATGTKVWSRNILSDSGNKLPDWGVSSSPLVAHGLVVVYAGGPADPKGAGREALLAYRADTGEPAWSAGAGAYSYSSAQLATLAGREQVLFVSNQGLIAVDPASGATLWEYAALGQPPRSCQPMPVGDAQLLVQLGMEAPTDLLDVVRSGDAFTATKRWSFAQPQAVVQRLRRARRLRLRVRRQHLLLRRPEDRRSQVEEGPLRHRPGAAARRPGGCCSSSPTRARRCWWRRSRTRSRSSAGSRP